MARRLANPSPELAIVLDLVYDSYRQANYGLGGLDSQSRDLSIAAELFRQLGIDWRRWTRVNVTGSKGKGSTSVLLASILRHAGERVGLITSPHMRAFNERIRVDGVCVSMAQVEDAARIIAPAVERVTADLEPPRYLGPGGIILALAAEIFRREGVTAIVAEAGRGGEYDESRLIDADVSVLTPVMLEHAEHLGDTVEAIARTKTRIASPRGRIVSGKQSDAAARAIAAVADELHAPVEFVDRVCAITAVRARSDGSTFRLEMDGLTFDDLVVSLPGVHQIDNAACAMLAAHRLTANDDRLMHAARDGLRDVRWPGRATTLATNPLVFLDGAINAASTREALDVLRSSAWRRLIAVVAVPKPKDLAGVCRELAPIADTLIVTEVDAPALQWYEDAAATAGTFVSDVEFIPDADDAMRRALALATPDDAIVLLGTQSFVGAMLDFWDIDACRSRRDDA